MSLIELFFVVYPYFCLFLINAAILAAALSHRICDTSSLRSTLVIVGFIIAGLAGLRSGEYSLPFSLFTLSVVLIACVMHYLQTKHAKAVSLHAQTPELYKRIK